MQMTTSREWASAPAAKLCDVTFGTRQLFNSETVRHAENRCIRSDDDEAGNESGDGAPDYCEHSTRFARGETAGESEESRKFLKFLEEPKMSEPARLSRPLLPASVLPPRRGRASRDGHQAWVVTAASQPVSRSRFRAL